MYNLTEDQLLIKNMVREFAESEVRPIAGAIDKEHRFPEESIPRMAELGLFGLTIPEGYGGSGGDVLSYILAVEELSRVSATHGVILSVHMSVCTQAILQYGTEAQKKKYLPDLAGGRKLGAFAITESGAGSDASGQTTSAVRKGDSYILNGTKIFISNGGYAGVFLVMAVTDRSKGLKGLTVFIVEKEFPGFMVGQLEEKMGICGSSTTEIILKDCVVPAENVLGEEGGGFKVAMGALDGGRISIGAQGVGLAQGALEAAVDYARQRVQFGRPIAENQGIQWMLADMALEVEASRLLVYNAARLKDQHKNYSRQSAMAKLHAAQTAMSVTTRAVQIHGGIGYTRSYPVERYMRDAKIIEIYEGTNEIQRMVIARHLLA
ncbi:MAG: acyl-CoA dehydrogenase [Deltaproteobacteria bacterium]|jgi:alkylation response protein AidB-like acyl-CoA dehydrogenase|nr:acyl-CoA dehydrogenase [Deltaproteobacteria bacterium]